MEDAVRVWDVNPGYLNRQSLLGEHREIHAIFSIVTHDKKGYAHHPETLRWKERKDKYRDRQAGRIPLPKTTQQLWTQHEYSILARDPAYRRRDKLPFEQLALECIEMLKTRPSEELVMDTLRRMWERVSQFAENVPDNPVALIEAVRDLSFKHHAVYLLESTALSDLHVWVSALLAD